MNPRRILLTLVGGLVTLACEPKFEPHGTLTIQGKTFQPTRCHVVPSPAGIALRDENGAQLDLAFAPTRVDAFTDYSFTPVATFNPGQGAPVLPLGVCGTLKLRGEGYHGSGKRAVSGHVSLACSGGTTLGTLEFTGCF
ncbi:MAG: hypothetical protein AB2A00_15540 [Myxococcota bacterium]